MDAQLQALAYGVKVAGCTVHLVDASCDTGPIVLKRTVEVFDDDTPEVLSACILEQEHITDPAALRRPLTRPWRLHGRRVILP